MAKLYSKKCLDPIGYWERTMNLCVMCPYSPKPGFGLTPNCGRSDDGGHHEGPYRKCPPGTFNKGNSAHCESCASACRAEHLSLSFCNRTTAECVSEMAKETTTTSLPRKKSPTSPEPRFTPSLEKTSPHVVLWAVPVVITAIFVAVLCAFFLYRKKKRDERLRLTHADEGFTILSSQPESNNLDDLLSPEIQSAPLQIVLDNLDVVEELVILLDPEVGGVKNTRHLASHCSFPSTWINYTYSMKDSRSPLKAVLQGVTSKHPDWTVGQLAKMLRVMGRNDALAVLNKLTLNDMIV